LNFGVDFVGGDLEQDLVFLDSVSGFLEPPADGSFGEGLSHLGHDNFD
jgi:hypothetical protein